MKNLTTFKILVLAVFLAATVPGKAQWEYMAPMPTAREFAASCVLDNKVYVIGGIFSDTSPATSVVEVYDPVTNTWNTNMPNLPYGVSAATAVVLDGKIYVIGGEDSYLGNKSMAVFEFDPLQWHVWTRKKDLPVGRSWHAAAVYDNTIYLMTGIAGIDILPDSAFLRYDKVNDEWIPDKKIPAPRGFSRAETAGGKLYAMGGMYYGDPYATVFAYDKVNWTTKAPMPMPKFWFGSGVIDDQIYVFGGYSSAFPPVNSSDTWRYDPVTDNWTNIGMEMPELIGGMASASAVDTNGKTCLYSLGGGFSLSEATDIVLKLNPNIINSSSEPIGTPAPVVLSQNYPNPFSNSTAIRYELRNSADVGIKIYDLVGQEVATVFNGFQPAGEYQIVWNAGKLPAGVYLYTLRAGAFVGTGKLMIQK